VPRENGHIADLRGVHGAGVYVFLRLFWVIWTALRAPKGPMKLESVLHLRVLPNDLDFNLHMNNGRYLTLMDLGRIDLTIRGGLLPFIRKNKWAPLLGNCTIRFRRSLAPFQKYTLRTRLMCWDDKWLYMMQSFETADGKIAALALVRGLFAGSAGTIPPNELLALVGVTQSSPPVPEAYSSWNHVDEALWAQAHDELEGVTR